MELGNDGNNLLAVLELYTDKTAYGVSQERNHVLFTIYEKSSLSDYVKATADVDRVLYIRKGASADTEASLQLAGAISKETLENNLAQFIKKIKTIREKIILTTSSLLAKTPLLVHFLLTPSKVSSRMISRSVRSRNTWARYYSQMICEDTSAHTGYVSYSGTSGNYYRAKVTFYATYSGGTGEYTVNTSKIKL